MNILEKKKNKFIFLIIFFMLSINIAFAQNPTEVCNIAKTKYFWIIYDNACPYCIESKEHIKALDWQGRFKFLSFRDPLTYKMFPNLNKEECEKDIHMVTPNGHVLAGYEVFRTILDNLAATKLLNPLLNNDVAEAKLLEIYQKLVKERSCYYNKTDTCPLKSRHKPIKK